MSRTTVEKPPRLTAKTLHKPGQTYRSQHPLASCSEMMILLHLLVPPLIPPHPPPLTLTLTPRPRMMILLHSLPLPPTLARALSRRGTQERPAGSISDNQAEDVRRVAAESSEFERLARVWVACIWTWHTMQGADIINALSVGVCFSGLFMHTGLDCLDTEMPERSFIETATNASSISHLSTEPNGSCLDPDRHRLR